MPEAFRRGNLRGARNITTKEELQEVLKQDKKILINCYLGHSASLLGADLVEAGYLNIYYLISFAEYLHRVAYFYLKSFLILLYFWLYV